jgi:polyhydroxyalkanoate synthesis regulator phasin
MKKYLLLSGLALCGLLITGVVFAQVNNNSSSFIEKLAERFNLNVEEVEEFFEENRPEFKGSEMRLDNLVEKGNITEEQKQSILDKQEEMRSAMEELKDLPIEERHEKMQALQEEMKQWAEDNGIDFPFMGGFIKSSEGRFRGEFKGHFNQEIEETEIE